MNPVDQQLAYQQMIGQRIDSGNQYALGIARLMQEGRVATTQLMQRQQALSFEGRRLNLEENEAPLKLSLLRQNIAATREQLAHNMAINPTLEAEAQLRLEAMQDQAETDSVVAQQAGTFASALNADLADNREAINNGQPVEWSRTDSLLQKYPRLAMDKRILGLRENADTALRYHEQYNQTQETRNLNRAASLRAQAAGLEATGGNLGTAAALRQQADLLEQSMQAKYGGRNQSTAATKDWAQYEALVAETDADTTLTPEQKTARKALIARRFIPGSGDTSADKEQRALFNAFIRLAEKDPRLMFDPKARDEVFMAARKLLEEEGMGGAVPAPAPAEDIFNARVAAAKQAIQSNPANTKLIKERFKQLTGKELPE